MRMRLTSGYSLAMVHRLAVAEANADDRVVAVVGQLAQQVGAVGAVLLGAELLDVGAHVGLGLLQALDREVVEGAVTAAAHVEGRQPGSSRLALLAGALALADPLADPPDPELLLLPPHGLSANADVAASATIFITGRKGVLLHR